MQVSRYRIVKTITLIAGLSIGAGLSYYYFSPTKETHGIVDFDDARDIKEALEIFKENWRWLISSGDYDAEYALRTRSPNARDLQYAGMMKIKVLRDPEKNKLIGFITYYKKSKLEGTVLFLAVREEYRGKGYAVKLMNYALEDLKKMGAHIATLLTRSENLQAQAVYRKTNFIETYRDPGYVYYAKQL